MELLITLYYQAFWTLITAAIFFSIFAFIPRFKCNNQENWWKNKILRTDLLYFLIGPIFYIFLRYLPIFIICSFLFLFLPSNQIYAYVLGGMGPLSQLSPLSQGILYLILSDFFMYWIHRCFHASILWPIHIIHHAAQEVDWTTSYRFHPLNLAFGSWLVTSMFICLGISSTNILWVTYINGIMSYFVHANLNITFGPFKYIIATPVFHRWHHTRLADGGTSNYGAIFSFWDVVFGTFYLPGNCLPENFGIENCIVGENIFRQLIYPFSAMMKSIFSIVYMKNSDS